ncbi:hypothetical protein HNO52_11630 [Billgrantia diversa]|uniref:hypothetical protein n=1 Tax=Halomonas sp. MCCC 1A13316 TaxID=2733487 RepID=UPI0018A5D43F|nr:hypothetical protein [Halomonas sp. MCCC 1A13316]QOR39093.1 hypothetical protein HNO52_11630 [Halomonas sp. MCCC 1A13316]
MIDLSAPMTYLLVMGSVALSVLFTLGWAFSRLLRWVASGFPLRSGKSAGKARGATSRRGGKTQKTAAAKCAPRSSAKPKAAKSVAKPPSEPWRITQRLATWHSSTALALVAAPTYLVARFAEHGIGFRPPRTLPSGFNALISGLGWLAAGLILLALIHRLAVWRCR